jgi:hypothetical protein
MDFKSTATVEDALFGHQKESHSSTRSSRSTHRNIKQDGTRIAHCFTSEDYQQLQDKTRGTKGVSIWHVTPKTIPIQYSNNKRQILSLPEAPF